MELGGGGGQALLQARTNFGRPGLPHVGGDDFAPVGWASRRPIRGRGRRSSSRRGPPQWAHRCSAYPARRGRPSLGTEHARCIRDRQSRAGAPRSHPDLESPRTSPLSGPTRLRITAAVEPRNASNSISRSPATSPSVSVAAAASSTLTRSPVWSAVAGSPPLHASTTTSLTLMARARDAAQRSAKTTLVRQVKPHDQLVHKAPSLIMARWPWVTIRPRPVCVRPVRIPSSPGPVLGSAAATRP